MKLYNTKRITKDPAAWRRKSRDERIRCLALLGGKCIVCGVDNPLWLHLDYKTGSRGMRYRHPRHFAYVSQHLDEFQVLCANHHYELTLTGHIEGTDITQ
jgi:hypothetical protein